MGVVISKPAINIREQLTELKAQQGYEERQFHFDNLVTNGTFDADTSGWSGILSGTLSVDTNRLKVTNGATDYGMASQTITTVAGKTYTLSVNFLGGSGITNGQVRAGITFGASNLGYATSVNLSPELLTVTFTAQGTSTYIAVNNNMPTSGAYGLYDNISVYPSDGTDVAFTMPKGWKPLHVYDDGVLQREGSAEDYEVTFDGFNYYVKPTVANPSARNTVIGVRA